MGGARVCALACVLVRVAQGTPCSDSSAVVCARVERDACSDTWFAARCCASCARLSKLAEVAADDVAATPHANSASTHAISVTRSVNQSSVDVSDVFASALREQAAREQAAREQLDPIASTHRIDMRASCLRLGLCPCAHGDRQPRIPVGRCGVGSLYDIYEEMRERNHRMVGDGSGFKPDEGLQVVQ